MAYNVNALAEYVNEQSFPILRKAIMGSKTIDLFEKQVGIKHSAALNFMDVDAVFQSNAAGETIQSIGDTTFTQRFITVNPVAVRQDYDVRWLNDKYLQTQVKSGSADDEIPFEADLIGRLVEKINESTEIAVWQGDVTLTGSSNVNKNKFNGFIKLLDGEASVVKVTGATITAANVIAQVDLIYTKIPVELYDKADTAIYMGMDTYVMYTQALKNANMFHYSVDGGDTFVVPGTNTKVYALNGLNGTGRIYAGQTSNFVTGHDLLGEEDNATAGYIFESEKVKVKIAFKMGVQVKFPSQIVTYKAA
ncbi:MAG: hypothetical protein DI539_20855 [Flavobacterium psychrophilum]|nr:MAG: hypothetical protein DI539_20855 [Flavobacterium psychrophilum]